MLEVPKGLTADNADFAFDAKSTRFAFAAGTQARLWDVVSGKQVASWELPPGLADRLAFQPDGSLLLFRMETRDGKPPYGEEFPWKAHPRVCPLRRLAAGTTPVTLAEIDTFNQGVSTAAMSADGSFVVVEGRGGPDGKRHAVKVFDGRTGKELHTLAANQPRSSAILAMDPAGTLVSFSTADRPGATLVALPSAQVAGTLDWVPWALGPGAELVESSDADGMFSLMRRKDQACLVTFAASTACFPPGPFNAAGTSWTCGHPQGAVLVCDIAELKHRMATIGLGW